MKTRTHAWIPATAFALLAVGLVSCRAVSSSRICGDIATDTECIRVLHDSLTSVLARYGQPEPPVIEVPAAEPDTGAVSVLECPEPEPCPSCDECAEPVIPLLISEDFCWRSPALGWLCLLPAGAPYDG